MQTQHVCMYACGAGRGGEEMIRKMEQTLGKSG